MSDDPSDETQPAVTPPVAEALGLTPPAEVARAALNRARAAARARGSSPGRRRRDGVPVPEGGPTGRDPVLVGDTLNRLATERGWSTDLSAGGVIGRWRELVGDQVADHCEPELFADGRLQLRADSTSWATQVRLLTPQILARIAQEVGPDVVQEIRVLGPRGPSWGRGRRSVPGRGPRDTYG